MRLPLGSPRSQVPKALPSFLQQLGAGAGPVPASRPAGPMAEGRAELLGRLGCQGGGESCGQHLGLGAGVCTQPAAPGSLDSPGCAQEACPPCPCTRTRVPAGVQQGPPGPRVLRLALRSPPCSPGHPPPEQDCQFLQQLSVTLCTFLLLPVPEFAVKTIIRDKVTIGK